MTKNAPSWEELNAYVDGELGPAAAAQVAEAAAEDRDISRTVAKLHSTRSALNAAYVADSVVIGVPQRSRHSVWLWPAVACLAIVVGLAAAFWLPPGRLAEESEPLATMLAGHEAWRLQPGTEPAAAPGGSKLGLPDLSDAGLSPMLVESLQGQAGSTITHVGYAGRRGCRLSLFIAPRGTAAKDAIPDDRQLQFAAWSAGAKDFYAIARGLNPTRFAVVVTALKAATQTPQPLEDGLRIALANARQPCTS